MENINYHDFLNMCRTCMLDIDLKPIEDKTIIEMLEIITDKNFKTNDELPQQICGMCIKKILDLHNFVKQCRISEDNFKICLANFRNECPSVTIDPGDKPMEVYVVESSRVNQETVKVAADPKTNKSVNFDSIINDMRKEFDVPPTAEDPLSPAKISKTGEKISEDSVELSSGDDGENIDDPVGEDQNSGGSDEDLGPEGGPDEHLEGPDDPDSDLQGQTTQSLPDLPSDPSTNKCTICARIFATRSSLLRHKSIHTRVFKCDECDKTFSESIHLEKHKRMHLNNRFECSVCNKCFKTGGNLSRHERTHTGAKPFRCTVCKKLFSSSSNLIKHQRIHNGLKPYKCPECDKEFRTSSNLAAHKSVHGNDRFECDVCDKFFRSENHLKRHLKTHSWDKSYPCKVCGKTFPYSSSLLKHKKIHLRK